MAVRFIIRAGFFIIAMTISAAIAVLFPFRVADCGPADPFLIRYLGAPFFSRTGHTISSSLESEFWALPLMVNILLMTGVIFPVFLVLGKIWPWCANRLQAWITCALVVPSLLWIGLMVYFVWYMNSFMWTGALPDHPGAFCNISWQLVPDTHGRQYSH